MFTTTPRRVPRDGQDPTPRTVGSPDSDGSTIRAQTFVVPMSSPTTCVLRRAIGQFLFVVIGCHAIRS
jgi:hypothetical protein